MRSRIPSFAATLCMVLGCALGMASVANAQIRIASDRTPKPNSSVHPLDLTPTTISLDLCVDGSAAYPCPNPISSDMTYNPTIDLTYGQVLDGLVRVDASIGTITLSVDGRVFCTLNVATGGSCDPASVVFDYGTHLVTGHFHADSIYADSDADPVVVNVAKNPSSIKLATSATPAALGTAVTFTAVVSGTYPATPTGQVIFSLDGTAQPAVALDASGTGTIASSTLALGMHTISASYAGALDFLPADDVSIPQQIVPPMTATTIASSLNPSTFGENVTFTSNVATAVPGIAPTGAVTFRDGTASFATVVVNPKGALNIAQASISTLAAGTHSITASYSGDAATSPSVSPVLVQQVDYPLTVPPPGYTITVTPAQVTLIAGQTEHLNVTVTPVSGFLGAVALTCGNLPNESACTFGETTIPIGGGSTTLALSTMSPHDCGSNVPYGGYGASLHPLSFGFGKIIAFGTPALAGVLLLLLPRRRALADRLKGLLALTIVCASAGLVGCGGNCTDFGTSPGSYTFKVDGAAQSATPVATGGGLPGGGGTATPNVSTSVALKVTL